MAEQRPRVLVQIHADDRQAQRVLNRAQYQVRNFTRGVSSQATIAAAAISGVVIAAGRTAAQFEQSFAKIQGLVGISGTPLEDLRKATLALGQDVGRGPNELADSLFFVTSAGFRGAEALELLDVSARASAAGMGHAAQVADVLTAAIGAYGSQNLTAARAGDVLTRTVEQGRLRSEQLSAVIGPLSGLASTLGIEFGELGGHIAALSRATNVAFAGTQLRGLYTALIKPAPQAVAELNRVGVSVERLRQQVANIGLVPALRELVERGADLPLILRDVQGIIGASQLVGPAYENNLAIIEKVQKSTGKLAEAYEAQATTATFKFRQQLGLLETEAIQLGTEVLPLFTGSVTAVGTAFRGSTAAIKDIPLALKIISGILGTGGLAGLILGPRVLQVRKNFKEFKSSLKGLVALPLDETAKKATKTKKALASFFLPLLGAKGIAALGAVAAFGTAWTLVSKNIRVAREEQEKFNRAVHGLDAVSGNTSLVEGLLARLENATGESPAGHDEVFAKYFGHAFTPTELRYGARRTDDYRLGAFIGGKFPKILNALGEGSGYLLRNAITQIIGSDVNKVGLEQIAAGRSVRLGGQRYSLGDFPLLAEVGRLLEDAGYSENEVRAARVEIARYGAHLRQQRKDAEAAGHALLKEEDVRQKIIAALGVQGVEMLRVYDETGNLNQILPQLAHKLGDVVPKLPEVAANLGELDESLEAVEDSAESAAEGITAVAQALDRLNNPLESGLGRVRSIDDFRRAQGELIEGLEEANADPDLLKNYVDRGFLAIQTHSGEEQKQVFRTVREGVLDYADAFGLSALETQTLTNHLLGAVGIYVSEQGRVGAGLRTLNDLLYGVLYPLDPIFSDKGGGSDAVDEEYIPYAGGVVNNWHVHAGADWDKFDDIRRDWERDEGRLVDDR